MMQNYIVPVNGEALKRALTGISGPQVAELVLRAYKEIDEAMAFGYQQGIADGDEKRKAAADEYVNALDATHMRGFEEGFKAAEANFEDDAQDAFDDGYVEGVDDARSNPAEADDYINYLVWLDVASEQSDLFDDLEPKENAHAEGESWVVEGTSEGVTGHFYDDWTHPVITNYEARDDAEFATMEIY